jgi:hypothetical protein
MNKLFFNMMVFLSNFSNSIKIWYFYQIFQIQSKYGIFIKFFKFNQNMVFLSNFSNSIKIWY